MSKLPTIQERPIPQAAPYNPQQVMVADTNAVPKAVAQFGQSLGQVGEAAIRIDEQRNRFEYSLAKSKFLQASTEIQRNVENDPDFEKMPQRYKEDMLKIRQDILSSSDLNDSYKSLLSNEMAIYEQKNYDNVLATYARKQYDYTIAQTGKAVENNFEAASRVTSEQDKEIILANSKNLFINAISLNDPQREEKIGRMEVELEQRMAKLDLMQKNPYQQVEMIDAENKKPNSNLTKYLTPEQRIQWKEKAQNDINALEREREALAERAEKQKKIRAEDELYNQVVIQGKSINQVDPQILLNAKESSVKAVEKIRMRQIGAGEVNPQKEELKYQEYKIMYIQEPEKFAELNRNEIAANVPYTKQEEMLGYLDKARNKIFAPATLKQQEEVASFTLKSIGKDPKNATFRTRFDEEIQAFKEEKGKDPSKKDLQDIANGLVVQQTFYRSILPGTSSKRLYEMDKEDIQEDIVVPENIIVEIQSEARKNGKRIPSEEEIKVFYANKLMRK
jgi:hypothetical protein